MKNIFLRKTPLIKFLCFILFILPVSAHDYQAENIDLIGKNTLSLEPVHGDLQTMQSVVVPSAWNTSNTIFFRLIPIVVDEQGESMLAPIPFTHLGGELVFSSSLKRGGHGVFKSPVILRPSVVSREDIDDAPTPKTEDTESNPQLTPFVPILREIPPRERFVGNGLWEVVRGEEMAEEDELKFGLMTPIFRSPSTVPFRLSELRTPTERSSEDGERDASGSDIRQTDVDSIRLSSQFSTDAGGSESGSGGRKTIDTDSTRLSSRLSLGGDESESMESTMAQFDSLRRSIYAQAEADERALLERANSKDWPRSKILKIWEQATIELNQAWKKLSRSEKNVKTSDSRATASSSSSMDVVGGSERATASSSSVSSTPLRTLMAEESFYAHPELPPLKEMLDQVSQYSDADLQRLYAILTPELRAKEARYTNAREAWRDFLENRRYVYEKAQEEEEQLISKSMEAGAKKLPIEEIKKIYRNAADHVNREGRVLKETLDKIEEDLSKYIQPFVYDLYHSEAWLVRELLTQTELIADKIKAAVVASGKQLRTIVLSIHSLNDMCGGCNRMWEEKIHEFKEKLARALEVPPESFGLGTIYSYSKTYEPKEARTSSSGDLMKGDKKLSPGEHLKRDRKPREGVEGPIPLSLFDQEVPPTVFYSMAPPNAQGTSVDIAATYGGP